MHIHLVLFSDSLFLWLPHFEAMLLVGCGYQYSLTKFTVTAGKGSTLGIGNVLTAHQCFEVHTSFSSAAGLQLRSDTLTMFVCTSAKLLNKPKEVAQLTQGCQILQANTKLELRPPQLWYKSQVLGAIKWSGGMLPCLHRVFALFIILLQQFWRTVVHRPSTLCPQNCHGITSEK